MRGSSSSFWMKWQCQCWRPENDLIEACQRCASGSFDRFNTRILAALAWATSRIDTVPQVRCGDRRELASKAVTGLDI
jgi:hypothetical protein